MVESLTYVYEFIKQNWADIVVAVTSIIGTASVVVRITPTPKDDAILAKVKKFISKFIALN